MGQFGGGRRSAARLLARSLASQDPGVRSQVAKRSQARAPHRAGPGDRCVCPPTTACISSKTTALTRQPKPKPSNVSSKYATAEIRIGGRETKMKLSSGHAKRTFILRFRQVRHPVFVRRLISYRPETKKVPTVSHSTSSARHAWAMASCRYLFVPPSAQGDARIVNQAGSKRKTHGIGIRKSINVGVWVDAVVTHVGGGGCRGHRACHVRAQRDSVLRLWLRLPVVERPHARERRRVRPVGVGWDRIHVLRHGRHAGGRIGCLARVCHGVPSRPGGRLRVGHVRNALGGRAAVVLLLRIAPGAESSFDRVRRACNRRVNV